MFSWSYVSAAEEERKRLEKERKKAEEDEKERQAKEKAKYYESSQLQNAGRFQFYYFLTNLIIFLITGFIFI